MKIELTHAAHTNREVLERLDDSEFAVLLEDFSDELQRRSMEVGGRAERMIGQDDGKFRALSLSRIAARLGDTRSDVFRCAVSLAPTTLEAARTMLNDLDPR